MHTQTHRLNGQTLTYAHEYTHAMRIAPFLLLSITAHSATKMELWVYSTDSFSAAAAASSSSSSVRLYFRLFSHVFRKVTRNKFMQSDARVYQCEMAKENTEKNPFVTSTFSTHIDSPIRCMHCRRRKFLNSLRHTHTLPTTIHSTHFVFLIAFSSSLQCEICVSMIQSYYVYLIEHCSPKTQNSIRLWNIYLRNETEQNEKKFV